MDPESYGNGWRYATEDEWFKRPVNSDFGSELEHKCAAHIFDPVFTTCAYGVDPVRIPDNSYSPLWIVCVDDLSNI